MRYLKSNRILILLLTLGTLTWSITMFKSGLTYPFGMGFWGPNGHDGVWHIALINSLSNGSLEMPVHAGVQIKNYHIGFDLILAILHKLTFIPTHVLYFQIIPPLLAVGVGTLTYKFVKKWHKSKESAFWATFLVYFGGSFGPLLTFVRGENFGGESMFWAQQAVSTLINPPFALSLVLLLIGCTLLLEYDKRSSRKGLLLLIIIFTLLTQIKVYAGILAIGALGSVGIIQLVKNKRFDYLLISMLCVLCSILLFIPLNRHSTSLLVFQPFWFLETMMAVSDRVGWPRFYEAMLNYKSGQVWFKLIPAYVVAFLIFWIGNLGIRIIGYWEVLKNAKKLSTVELFLFLISFFGLILPMLFLQKGTPWNTIQFFYYTIFIMSIFTGITFATWLDKSITHVRYLLVTFLLLFNFLTVYATLKHYLPSRPPAKLSSQELEALNFLSKQTIGVVLTYPYDIYLAEKALNNPPRSLRFYESTAYVSAFSAKPVFLEDEVNLNIMSFDWKTRRKEVEEWLETLDADKAHTFLREKNIRYVYWVKPQRARLGETQLGITRLFENKEVDIYKVN